MERNVYNTKQKQFILEILKSNLDKPLSPSNILSMFDKDKTNVSKSTVYRYLDNLYEEGAVNRYYNETLQAYEYQLSSKDDHCHSHLHLRCMNCGEVIHLDCGTADEFNEHIFKDHGFLIDQKNTLIVGLCNKCKGENK